VVPDNTAAPQVGISIFGPSEGLKVFNLATLREIDYSQVALSENYFQPAQGGRIAWLQRFRRESNTSVGTAFLLGQQVFEPNMTRGGHMFGVCFEFGAEVPKGNVLLDVASDLLKEVQTHCVKNERIQNTESFISSIRDHIEPLHQGIINALGAFSRRPTRNHPSLERKAYSRQVTGLTAESDTARIIDWYLRGLGAFSCERLLLYETRSGKPGTSVSPLPELELLDAIAFDALHRHLVAIIDDFRPKAMRAENLQSELAALTEGFRSNSIQLEQTRKEAESMREQLRSVRRRAGDDPYRLAVVREDGKQPLAQHHRPGGPTTGQSSCSASAVQDALITKLNSVQTEILSRIDKHLIAETAKQRPIEASNYNYTVDNQTSFGRIKWAKWTIGGLFVCFMAIASIALLYLVTTRS
jgi:hypothetical protein